MNQIELEEQFIWHGERWNTARTKCAEPESTGEGDRRITVGSSKVLKYVPLREVLRELDIAV